MAGVSRFKALGSVFLQRKAKWKWLEDLQKGKWTRAVVRALWVPEYEKRRTYCQRFFRQITQSKLGRMFDSCHDETAALTARNFIERGKQVTDGRPGDIYFKIRVDGDGNRLFDKKHPGHVGVRVWGNWIVENSSIHAPDELNDARGIRSVEDFCAGKDDIVIIRLMPDLK